MPKIDTVFAFITEDAGPGDEGILAATFPNGMTMPLVGADLARVDSLREVAQSLCNKFGKPVRLVHFKEMEEVETLIPTTN